MPLSRNPLFVGRVGDLRRIATALDVGQAPAPGRTIAATGMGGLGKTCLAVEFVHRYGRQFAGGVYWLSFANADDVALQVAACGGPGFMELRTGFDDLPLEQQLALVVSDWQSDALRLLVFDNCEDEALLVKWRPPSGGCRVLVTARRSSWDPTLGVQALSVDVLSRGESLQLLTRYVPDVATGDPSLDAIAGEMGDLPLGLHLAGSFLRRYRAEVTPAEYVEHLRTQMSLDGAAALTGAVSSLPERMQSLRGVAQSFDLSYRRLDDDSEVDRTARALLARAICFAPGELIPRDLLARTMDGPANLENRLLRADAMNRLGELSLVEEMGDEVRVHRLVARFLRHVCFDPRALEAVETVLIECGRSALRGRASGSALLALMPHLRHATAQAVKRNEDERSAALCGALGIALHARGELAAAESLLRRALATRERLVGPDNIDIAANLYDLGCLLMNRGELAAAAPYLERALGIRERSLEPDHPDLVASISALAELLWLQGDLDAARAGMERALAARERTLGPDHPDVATSLSDLGVVLHTLGELQTARVLHERSLAIRERTLGTAHIGTAVSLNNLAWVLTAVGDLSAARTAHERVLAITHEVVGPEHPDLARALHNLGYTLWMQRELPAAGALHEQALALRERLLGGHHYDTGRSLHSLAQVLIDQGRFEPARRLLARALAIQTQAVGPSHRLTREVRSTLDELDRRATRQHARRRQPTRRPTQPGPAE